MRIAAIPAPSGDRLIYWDQVVGVRYLSEGRMRFLVLSYRDGSERRLQPHQARDLWDEVEEHKGCSAPCYYRHEADTSPTDCMSCQLAQHLAGLEIEVRPAPVPPRKRRDRGATWRDAVILWLVGLVLLLIAALQATQSPALPSKTPDEPPPVRVKGSRG